MYSWLCLRTVSLVAACLLLVDATAAERKIFVPRDFDTVQAAIDEASTGDTVLVAPGTYAESIDFQGKHVNLVSVNGAEATKLTYEKEVIKIGPLGVVRGFTITAPDGNAVTCKGSDTVIESCIFEGNGTRDGQYSTCIGGAASPVICRNIFRFNGGRRTYASNVIGFSNSSSPHVANNLFHDNTTVAISFELPSKTNAVATNNTIVNCGGGIYGGAYVANNIIANCKKAVHRHSNMPANWVFENNLLFGNEEGITSDRSQNKGVERKTILKNPRFVNAKLDDYRLLPISPAIDTGTDRRAPDEDLLGLMRPAPLEIGEEPRFDIGAYEFHPEGFKPDSSVLEKKEEDGQFILLSALWGRGSTWKDVSERYTAFRTESGLRIVTDSRELKEDPVPKKPKRLALHYRIGDREYHRAFDEGETGLIRLPSPPASTNDADEKFFIVQATYGIGSSVEDRTQWLRSTVEAGVSQLRIGPEDLYIDPAPGREKIMAVAFYLNGRYRTETARDGQVLALDNTSPTTGESEDNNVLPTPKPAVQISKPAVKRTLKSSANTIKVDEVTPELRRSARVQRGEEALAAPGQVSGGHSRVTLSGANVAPGNWEIVFAGPKDRILLNRATGETYILRSKERKWVQLRRETTDPAEAKVEPQSRYGTQHSQGTQ